jgi:hypothetical protein
VRDRHAEERTVRWLDDYCADCEALDSPDPRPREGRSERCLFHLNKWRAWNSLKRQRKLRGQEPPAPYDPIPAPELPGERWLTREEVDYLDDLTGRVRATQNPIDNSLRSSDSRLTKRQIADYAQAVGQLTDAISRVLWREDRLPPRRRRRPATLKPPADA